MKLYNVTARVVDLVWAEDEADAMRKLTTTLEASSFEVLPDSDGRQVEATIGAFVSEPVPDMGWEGDDS